VQHPGVSTQNSDTRTDKSLWRILGETAWAAPLWGRVLIGISATVILGVTVAAVWDVIHSGRPEAGIRVASLALSNTGLLFLGISGMLHKFTQKRKSDSLLWCGPLQNKPHRPHAVMMALPLLSFVSGCLVAAGTVLLVPSMIDPIRPRYMAVGLMYVAFIYVAGVTVRDTTRFLYRYAGEQAQKAARAQAEATQAQISALQAQMNPHFLFNALNTVASLVRTDAKAAEHTVENLAQVLRRTLDRSQRPLSTVEDEIGYLRAYVSVETERFGDRLTVEWDVDPRTEHLMIPPMTLQPLVENALKHGVGGRLRGGTIRIASQLEESALVLEVADDGAGFPARYSEGTGLSNLRQRLQTLYGDSSALSVSPGGDGARVTITIPADWSDFEGLAFTKPNGNGGETS
jgi:two-component sensor histidine kinase